ncbi:MAG: hypothetical protein AB1813_02780 [Verrucomicrobiota bacterium]
MKMFLFVAVLCVALLGPSLTGSDLPRELTAEEIVTRTVARAEAQRQAALRYTFQKRSISEVLDEGRLRKRKENLYLVVPVQEFTYERLLQKNGQPLTALERKKETEKERKFRLRVSNGKPPRTDDERDVSLDEALIARYDFRLKGREVKEGRPVFVLEFVPKGNVPAREMQDRVLNRLKGVAWVDVEDFELVRLEVALMEKVTLGLGLAAMHEFTLEMARTRLADGTWMDTFLGGAMKFRELFNVKQVKFEETMSGFQLVTERLADQRDMQENPGLD